jgi:hypothetical protein
MGFEWNGFKCEKYSGRVGVTRENWRICDDDFPWLCVSDNGSLHIVVTDTQVVNDDFESMELGVDFNDLVTGFVSTFLSGDKYQDDCRFCYGDVVDVLAAKHEAVALLEMMIERIKEDSRF